MTFQESEPQRKLAVVSGGCNLCHWTTEQSESLIQYHIKEQLNRLLKGVKSAFEAHNKECHGRQAKFIIKPVR